MTQYKATLIGALAGVVVAMVMEHLHWRKQPQDYGQGGIMRDSYYDLMGGTWRCLFAIVIGAVVGFLGHYSK